MIHYNPLDKFYKSQIGAVCANNSIKFRVKGNFDSVLFVYKKDGENEEKFIKMKENDGVFETNVEFCVGLYFYYFKVNENTFISLSEDYVGELSHSKKYFQLTAYTADFVVPKWIYGGVIYQIFPDRFFTSNMQKKVESDKILHKNWDETPVYLPNENGKIVNNDFFGGDLIGIKEKLDYIRSLGVNTIYLNPIFKSYSNHRYDTGDYMQIDPLLGTECDLKNLILDADKNGIKIVLDGVFNHTGDDSVYFNKFGNYDSVGAYQDKNSKYYKWYNFTDYPNEYSAWWGVETLPAINKDNENFFDFIAGDNGVIEHYTRMGIGGWRLDVVDELSPKFVKKIREKIKQVDPNGIVIGEVWEDVSNKISYGERREYFQGKELDSAMNYPLKNAIINFVKDGDSKNLLKTIKEQIDHYPSLSLHAMMNIISTHDTMRLLSVVGGEDPLFMTKKQMAEYFLPIEKFQSAKFKLKIASLLQFTLCGVPSIYYGDEIGMQGYVDPLNRKTFPWGKEDNELLSWYRFLGQLRRKYSAFALGEFKEVFIDDNVFIFSRKDEESELLIAVNLSDKEFDLEYEGDLYELISEKTHNQKCTMLAKSCGIFIKK